MKKSRSFFQNSEILTALPEVRIIFQREVFRLIRAADRMIMTEEAADRMIMTEEAADLSTVMEIFTAVTAM